MVIVGGHGFPNLDELLGQRFDWRGPDDPAGEVVQRREPVIIPDVSARFEHFKDETHGGGRVKGWMGVPLLFGDSLIGMLTLDKLDADFYTAEHAHMAGAFAAYAAAAIERARLFNEIESLLEEAKDARGRLVDAIENSSEGFVFFDADDRLVLCNTRYQELLYPGATFAIEPGMAFEAIIRAAAESGYVADADARNRRMGRGAPGDPSQSGGAVAPAAQRRSLGPDHRAQDGGRRIRRDLLRHHRSQATRGGAHGEIQCASATLAATGEVPLSSDLRLDFRREAGGQARQPAQEADRVLLGYRKLHGDDGTASARGPEPAAQPLPHGDVARSRSPTVRRSTSTWATRS